MHLRIYRIFAHSFIQYTIIVWTKRRNSSEIGKSIFDYSFNIKPSLRRSFVIIKYIFVINEIGFYCSTMIRLLYKKFGTNRSFYRPENIFIEFFITLIINPVYRLLCRIIKFTNKPETFFFIFGTPLDLITDYLLIAPNQKFLKINLQLLNG